MATGIPTINLHDYTHGSAVERAAMVRTLGDGLREFGFLTIEHHGIDQKLIRDTYALFKEFFALPEIAKKKYADGKGERGYVPFGVEHAKDSQVPDLKEFWHVGQELPAGHPLRQVYPPNTWPREVPQLKPVALELYRRLEACADVILKALADYFELPTTTFSKLINAGNSVLRAIHYPPVPADADPQAVRAAAHEDINMITLLCEATDAGLELLRRDGTWMPIQALEGQIVVDTGDMMARMTNEVVPATTHRVVNPDNSRTERYSMPFFVHPFPAADLSVMPNFITAERPAKFPPITAGEFLDQRLREIGVKK